jgi:ribosomal protein S6--L-glutamate ligase
MKMKKKILLISYLDTSEATRIFMEVAKRHALDVIFCTHRTHSLYLPDRHAVNGEHRSPYITHPTLPKADIAFTRIGSVTPQSILPLVRACEVGGIPTVNSFQALFLGRNKLLSYAVLSENNIPIPRTVSLSEISGIDEAFITEILGEPPYVVKLIQGRKGIGVVRLDSLTSLRSQLDLLRELGQECIIQECIRLPVVRDIRVLVVGGCAIAALTRTVSTPHEFRSNLAVGGSAQKWELTPAVTHLAEGAAKALGLDIAGVDILESSDGPLVIEVNLSPGLKGFEITGQMFAVDAIFEHLRNVMD